MRLGIITDIHEHVEFLAAALTCFDAQGTDQVVVIGDLFETGERIEETCRLLAEANAIGVWGNHDFGLCFDVNQETRAKYSLQVLEFMGSLRPRLEIADCHFMHIEPWLDPTSLQDLWYYGGLPNNRQQLERIFQAVPNRLIFAGHYHQWLLATPKAVSRWCGDQSIRLNDGRYFVVVGALFEGHYAIFDTDTSELVPLSVRCG